jgi:multidrug efflux pump subunit AcrB
VAIRAARAHALHDVAAYGETCGTVERVDFSLRHLAIVLVVAVATFVGSGYLFIAILKGFFPQEDIGMKAMIRVT